MKRFLYIFLIFIAFNLYSSFEPQYPDKFYGAPAPFKMSENLEGIRFYYKLKNDCYVTIKIYDINYNLVRVLNKKRRYNAGENIDALWDGKNGKGIKVLSGIYIAVMEIETLAGEKFKPDPFTFAVIK